MITCRMMSHDGLVQTMYSFESAFGQNNKNLHCRIGGREGEGGE